MKLRKQIHCVEYVKQFVARVLCLNEKEMLQKLRQFFWQARNILQPFTDHCYRKVFLNKAHCCRLKTKQG